MARSGSYYVVTDTPSRKSRVYCHMESLGMCGGGGWTTVMKLNGDKVWYLENCFRDQYFVNHYNYLSMQWRSFLYAYTHVRTSGNQNFTINIQQKCQV